VDKFDQPYPFTKYDQVFVPEYNIGAMENVGCVTFNESYVYRSKATDAAHKGRAETILHELAHMWFGDSVSPYSWSDLWLNEGHATWYELVYADEEGQLVGHTEGGWPDPQGYATLEELMRGVYAHGDEWRKQSGPVALPESGQVVKLFSYQVYFGGALVLYALRQKIGESAFEQIERTWVTRYRDGVASTDDFIALATEISGDASVTPFLRDWLYGEKTPPMPGHPDWTVNPVGSIR
jgi:aminopeptidase N